MIYKMLKKTYGPLIFSLFCGLVYFGLALVLILKYTNVGGGLLAFFFAPAIICGGALIIVKTVKMHIEEEAESKLKFLFWSHILLAIVSLTLVIGALVV